MSFNNLILNYLLTRPYRFIPSILIWSFDFDSINSIIGQLNKWKIKKHWVDTLSEVSQNSNVKIVFYVKRKTWSNEYKRKAKNVIKRIQNVKRIK